jgi:hypothetical protein
MKSGIKPRQPRPLWRRILRILAWLLFALSLPVIAFVVWNRIDEAPTERALHYASPTPIRVADADNAWLAMAGLGASPEDMPAALGRRRVDAFRARYEQHPIPPADDSEIALFKDAVPAVRPDPAVHGTASLCPARDIDCLFWALRHRAMLDDLREANALRLQRYEDLMKLPGWQALYPETPDGPLIDFSIARLHLNLIALELANHQLPGHGADVTASLDRLAADVEFWQRVRSAPQDLMTVAVSGAHVEEAYWILSTWIDRSNGDQLPKHADTIQRILARNQAPVDWEVAARDHFQETDRAMSDALPGLTGTLGQCFSGTTTWGCFSTLAFTTAYAPQATRNILAVDTDLMQEVLDAPPSELKQVSAVASRRITDTFLQFDDIGVLLGQMSYNFAGRVFANISIPAYDYGRREHDREALRRIVQIKLAARLDGIGAAAMPDFLPGLDDALRNPLNGQPFDWDPVLQTFHFAPLADKDWKRTRVDLGYRIPREPGYEDCTDPVVFDVSELDGDVPFGADLRFVSCGSGFWPLWLNSEEAGGDDVGPWPERYQKIDVRRRGDQLSSEITLEYGLTTLAYRAVIDIHDGSFDTSMDPIGGEAGPRLRLRSTQQAALAMVVVNVDNMPARELAHAVARIKHLDLIGERLLTDTPVSMHFEQSAAEIMNLLADVSDLRLRESPPRRFEFMRPPKPPAQ